MEEPVVNVREFICSYDNSSSETFNIEGASEFFKKKLYDAIPSYTKLDSFLGIEVSIRSSNAYDDGYCTCAIEFYGIRPETINEKEKREKWEARQRAANTRREVSERRRKDKAAKAKDERDRKTYDKLKKKFER